MELGCDTERMGGAAEMMSTAEQFAVLILAVFILGLLAWALIKIFGG
jgi:hypothetical protein